MNRQRTAAIATVTALVILAGAVAAFAITGTAGPGTAEMPGIQAPLPSDASLAAAPAPAPEATAPAPADAPITSGSGESGAGKPSETFSGGAEDASSLNGVGGGTRETVKPPVRDEDDDDDEHGDSHSATESTPPPTDGTPQGGDGQVPQSPEDSRGDSSGRNGDNHR